MIHKTLFYYYYTVHVVKQYWDEENEIGATADVPQVLYHSDEAQQFITDIQHNDCNPPHRYSDNHSPIHVLGVSGHPTSDNPSASHRQCHYTVIQWRIYRNYKSILKFRGSDLLCFILALLGALFVEHTHTYTLSLLQYCLPFPTTNPLL